MANVLDSEIVVGLSLRCVMANVLDSDIVVMRESLLCNV